MISNYIRTALRSLWRNWSYSLLNIFGLAIGIACTGLIFLWIEGEASFNNTYPKKRQLYKVMQNQSFQDGMSTVRATSGPLAKALTVEIPGIKNAARLSFNSEFRQLLSVGDKKINAQGYYADASLFDMLQLPFAQGTRDRAFDQVNSLVISESLSSLLFGAINPIGKLVRVNDNQLFTITGVFKDVAQNSTLQFQWLAPFEVFASTRDWLKGWNNNGVHTLVELTKKANPRIVNEALHDFLYSKDSQLHNAHCFLFPMDEWHLYNEFSNGVQVGGQIKYVRLFGLIACVILVIASINFVNLATAHADRRAKEVGVRKAIGANRTKLITQFMTESCLLAFFSVAIAVALMAAALPEFNTLVGRNLELVLANPLHLLFLMSIGIISGIMAGTYPAIYLSDFNAVDVFKGARINSGFRGGFIRKGLVVVQFSASIALVISTVVIYQQVVHTRNRNLGYQKDMLVYATAYPPLKNHFDAARTELLATNMISEVSLSADPLLQVGSSSDGFQWAGKAATEHVNVYTEFVSPQYLATSGIQLAEGSDFHSNVSLDSNSVIINEALAGLLRSAEVIGSVIRSGDRSYTVIGVVKDFVFNDVYNYSEPLMLFCSTAETEVVTLRLSSGANLEEALATTETVMRQYAPGYLFELRFVNDDFNQLFKTEIFTGRLAGVFSALAILISCIGLFGLAAYTARRRRKEISIRKVHGASIEGLTGLLSMAFVKLVLISCVIAFPLSWIAMNRWLQNYAYRTQLHWWVFVCAGLLACVVALGTVSVQAVRAALANPIKTLRTE